MIVKMKKTLSFMLGVACVGVAGIGVQSLSLRADTSTAIQSYTVVINADSVDNFRGVLTRELPAEAATKVTVEYTVESSSGGAAIYTFMRGAFYGISYPEAGAYTQFWQGGNASNTDSYRELFFDDGATYKIVYDLANVEGITGTRANSSYNNEDIYLPYKSYPNTNKEWVSAHDYHFGFGFRQGQDILDAGLGLQAELTVKCYDDTGKDLGVTYSATGDTITLKNGLSEPEHSTLTNFEKTDTLLVNGNTNKVDGNASSGVIGASLHPDFAKIEQTAETDALGADGAVLKLIPDQTSNRSHLYRIVFGKAMTKDQIAAGYDLSIRTYVKANGGDYIRYSHIFPCDDTVANRNGKAFKIGDSLYELQSKKAFDDGFQTIVIPNAELKDLADEDGNIRGFSVMIAQGPTGAYFEWYLDSVSVSTPLSVRFHSADGETLSENEVRAGYMSLADQVQVDVPAVDGKAFVGWVTAKDGTEFFDTNAVLALGQTSLDLYAKYETGVEDVSAVVGVWANAQTGEYISLNADKTVSSIWSNITYKSFDMTASGKVVFDNVAIFALNGTKLTKDGVTYEKQETVYKAEYLVPSGVFASVQVPSGYMIPDLSMEDPDYVFEGWTVADKAYAFDTPVTADITLQAKVTVDELEDKAYADYANTYKNVQGKLYILADKKDGKAVLTAVENGVVTETEYTLTKAGNILIGGKSSPITPLCVMEGEAYLWKITEQYIVTLYYNDDAQTSRTVTVDRTMNYIFAVPEAPEAREGYTFDGWYLGDGTKFEERVITTATSIYARWKNADEQPYAPMPEKKEEGCASVAGTGSVLLLTLGLGAVALLRKNKEDN